MSNAILPQGQRIQVKSKKEIKKKRREKEKKTERLHEREPSPPSDTHTANYSMAFGSSMELLQIGHDYARPPSLLPSPLAILSLLPSHPSSVSLSYSLPILLPVFLCLGYFPLLPVLVLPLCTRYPSITCAALLWDNLLLHHYFFITFFIHHLLHISACIKFALLELYILS